MHPPQAKLNFQRGHIAVARRDEETAISLLRQATLDHPFNAKIAAVYLSNWLYGKNPTKPFAKTTEPFATKFPENAQILSIHAVALVGDNLRYDAYQTWSRACELNQLGIRLLPKEDVEVLEQGRWFTSNVMKGIDMSKNELHFEAVKEFRSALKQDRKNIVAAQHLAKSLLATIVRFDRRGRKTIDPNSVGECLRLCETFPDDPNLRVAYGVSQFLSGNPSEALKSFQQAESLGADLNKLVGAEGLKQVRKEAQEEETRKLVPQVLLSIGAGFLAWIVIMFATGALLAVCIPRTPDSTMAFGQAVSQKEVWLERFYLTMLSLSLFVFYLTVPIVLLGLLVVTLGLFVMLLVLRVIHVGVLHRGFFAICGIARGAFLSSSGEVVGLAISKEQQPQLFDALDDVANQIETDTVDTVYLTPRAEIGVRQDGHGPFGMIGRKRVLQIGMSALSSLTTAEFKSVLAHEFGHFTHQDHFYTRFISQVSMSLSYSLSVLAAAGGEVITYVNPFFWFYWLYLRAYALLAAGFSRSREFLADRRAVLAYGKEPFISGLTKLCVDGASFGSTAAESVLKEFNLEKTHFTNVFEVYRTHLQLPKNVETVQTRRKKLSEVKPKWFDSHPTYTERITALEHFTTSPQANDTNPATSLISDLDKVEQDLTEIFARQIHYQIEMLHMARQQG